MLRCVQFKINVTFEMLRCVAFEMWRLRCCVAFDTVGMLRCVRNVALRCICDCGNVAFSIE